MRDRLLHIRNGILQLAVAAAIGLSFWLWPEFHTWMGGKWAFSVLGLGTLLTLFGLASLVAAIRGTRPDSGDKEGGT
jgi:hypothetical protein